MYFKRHDVLVYVNEVNRKQIFDLTFVSNTIHNLFQLSDTSFTNKTVQIIFHDIDFVGKQYYMLRVSYFEEKTISLSTDFSRTTPKIYIFFCWPYVNNHIRGVLTTVVAPRVLALGPEPRHLRSITIQLLFVAYQLSIHN